MSDYDGDELNLTNAYDDPNAISYGYDESEYDSDVINDMDVYDSLEEPTPLSFVMESLLSLKRDDVANTWADLYTEPCPVCGELAWAAVAQSIALRADKEFRDYVDEVILFVCTDCGSVFWTDDLTIDSNQTVAGKLVQETESLSLIADLHEVIGWINSD